MKKKSTHKAAATEAEKKARQVHDIIGILFSDQQIPEDDADDMRLWLSENKQII